MYVYMYIKKSNHYRTHLGRSAVNVPILARYDGVLLLPQTTDFAFQFADLLNQRPFSMGLEVC